MTRRTFFPAIAAAAAVSNPTSGGAAEQRPQTVFELCFYRLRNTAAAQAARTTEFLSRVHAPAMKRAGAAVAGLFRSSIAEQTPFLLSLFSFSNLAAYEEAVERLAVDGEYRKQAESYFSTSQGAAFERIETRLLKAFPKVPGVQELPQKEGGRIFELRTYESATPLTLWRKVEMFQSAGEIPIFLKCGIQPVFFATTLAGPRMPNLVYMTAFDSLAAREQAWSKFSAHPEWQALRSKPEFSDAEIVSNISIMILTPLAGSDIR